jgi:xanthine dehydrogenase iron-sulfur cluster and FAD-binding subunit A
VALLNQKPKPTDEDIDTAMNGNICRCATYLRIRQAIHQAAAATTTNTPFDSLRENAELAQGKQAVAQRGEE